MNSKLLVVNFLEKIVVQNSIQNSNFHATYRISRID